MSKRFTFLRRTAACLLAVACAQTMARADSAQVADKVPAQQRQALYTGNREPLQTSPLVKLPIGSITPKGWLRTMLETEAQGMTGRLAEISPWLNFDNNGWSGKGKGGWEEMPYWLKGYGDLGYVLKDQKIIAASRKWIDAALNTQTEDGWFGPQELKTSLGGKPDMWPNMVMLNVLQSWYEYSGDERILPFMTRYFKWQNTLPPECFGAGYWPKIRFGDNIESIYWLYNRTGDAFLLELATKIHKNMANWTADICDWHNVNLAQAFREPAIYGQQTGDPSFFAATIRNYNKLMGLYGQFPGGGFAGDENCRPGFGDPRQGLETCGFVEFTHSFQLLTRASGDPVWADRCEEIAFNSMPAMQPADQKGLHYITPANVVQLDRKPKGRGFQNGFPMLHYSPFQEYRCCQHNVSHGWPYYAEELWLGTADKGLCASLYAASEVKAKVADGTEVKISEETDYPFSDTITLKLTAPKSVQFPLYLRIPAWCKSPAVKVNGQAIEASAKPSSYLIVSREWKDGDVVTLQLPMQITVKTWEKNKNAASVAYGPIWFSLKIGEDWKKFGDKPEWPLWEVFATTPWNYGLVLDPQNPAKSFELKKKEGPVAAQPFTHETAPMQLTVKAKKISNWQLEPNGMLPVLQPSPIKSDQPEETVTLIPMGAARLRISAFPTIGDGPEAQEWKPTAVPAARIRGGIKATASHTFDGDTIDALNDNVLPASSAGGDAPRHTFWDHKGSAEWLQYEFVQPRKLSSAAVYWFDDTGAGDCRVPKSWKLLYKDGNDWKPVQTTDEFGVKKDQLNTVSFKEVETSALKIEVQLQDDFSGGVLEWQVK